MDNRDKNGVEFVNSRQQKNQKLYDDIGNSDINNFNVFSNTSVIGTSNDNNLDIEKIKKILDTKYKDAPKRKTIKIEEEIHLVKEVEDTKEYDINVILDKAKSELEPSYEVEKVKKPNFDPSDILKNLDLPTEEVNDNYEEDEHSVTLTKDQPKELYDLINTIVINEKKLKEENTEMALDLFEDLKADEDEETVDVTKNKSRESIEIEEIQVEKINVSSLEEKEEKEEETFLTKENKFKKSDFESLSDDGEDSDIVFKIIIFILIISFVAGMYYFLTNFLTF